MSISGKWKKTVLGLILSGIVVISAGSAAWAQTKTEAKNPFALDPFFSKAEGVATDAEKEEAGRRVHGRHGCFRRILHQ